MSRKHTVSIAFATAMLACALPGRSMADPAGKGDDLTGAWRGAVQFLSGAFAEVKDLELMYAFIAGGTMTESSNYDAVPPVPPAYGVWKKVGAGTYEARYQFFQSRTVASADELVKAGGWGAAGYGIISQTITLSADGKSFDSKLHLELFGQDGKPVAGGGDATAKGTRIE
ncbi:MAG: hypothetical protein WCF43_13055 [Steroidobacteraceae bacterium]